MNCKELETTAIAYLDGKLAPAQREAVDSHLTACAACKERMQGFSGVLDLLGEWEPIQPSPYFNARLARRIEQEGAGKRWRGESLWDRWSFRPVAQSAFAMALVAVVTLGLALLQYSPAPVETAGGAPAPVVAVSASEADDPALYANMALLEDWDVLRNFEVLQELSAPER